MSMTRHVRLLSFAVVLGSTVASRPSSAAVLCVNPGGTGGCLATIQAAIDIAVSGDVIDIAAGTYAESLAIGPSRGTLTLQGAGVGATIIDVGISAPGLCVPCGGNVGKSKVTISGVTIQNASVGVQVTVNSTAVTLKDSAIAGCQWGIRSGGKLTVSRSSITSATGIEAAGGSATISDSTLGGGAFGLTIAQRAKVTLTRSAVANGGGGVFVSGGGRLVLDTSTVSGNSLAGGIQADSRSNVKIKASTISNNTMNSGAGGGGILFVGDPMRPPTVALERTIIADNGINGGSGPDCNTGLIGRLHVRNGNLVENTTACAMVAHGMVLSVDPMLGVLQNNGGPTETQALQMGSPAIGVLLANGLCKSPDQRGVARSAPCDLGAYEAP